MSRGRPKKEKPAVKQAKIDEELNSWLTFLQDKAAAAGGKVPSQNELLKSGILCLYPKIQHASDEYQRQQAKLRKSAIELDPGNGGK